MGWPAGETPSKGPDVCPMGAILGDIKDQHC